MAEVVWQIACGEAGRRYESLFLDHDLMLLGPGSFGAYDPAIYDNGIARHQYSAQKVGSVRRFAEDIKPGDFVLLRSGKRVLSLGVVADEPYVWDNERFDDVYGWDLQHRRRVLWQQHLDATLSDIQRQAELFSDRKQIPTFTGVDDATIRDRICDLLPQCRERDLRDLPPKPPEPMAMAELSQALFTKGLPYDAVSRVRVTIEKQQELLRWYNSVHAPKRPSEHEIVAHVILPMMAALGWSEQLLAVEWRKIDLAVFCDTPTDEANCRLVCEAKAMGSPLENVVSQAKKYCRQYALAACDKILVADGGRFYLYRRQKNDQWEEAPSGYLNVSKIRKQYLLPVNTSAVDTLIALTPMHVARQSSY